MTGAKALLRSGTALHAAQQLPGAREAITSSLDVKAILERRNGLRAATGQARVSSGPRQGRRRPVRARHPQGERSSTRRNVLSDRMVTW